MNLNIIKKSLLVSFLLITFGCTTNLGDFTVLSTVNVKGLVSQKDTQKRVSTSGKTCLYRILFIPIGDMSLSFKNAADNAIKNGRMNGAKDGDLLEDARIRVEDLEFFVAARRCVIVEGDLVSSSIK